MDGMRLVSIYVENNKQLQRVRQVPATPTPPHQVEEGSTMTIDSQLTTLSWTPTTTGDIGWWRSWLFYSSPVVQVSFESVTSIERSDEWPHALTKPAAPEVSPVHGVWVDTPSLRLWLQCHDEAEQVQVVTSFQRYVQSAKKRTADNNSTRHE
ncbi:hypothetical protein AaE_000047 [Aphanomyces astaci]|uniref:Uncharacterized protein n=1 Tax=Aphanomyces astaci TaxID=112090 RepID=A0A6A5B2D4_APHAT|nr:hypothetical protein AaE_000047 [Aphanomyces astaci]